MKNYWSWKCHQCGHDDNRNTNKACLKCGAPGRCEALGGCSWEPESTHCDNGCGRTRSNKIELEHRRPDY